MKRREQGWGFWDKGPVKSAKYMCQFVRANCVVSDELNHLMDNFCLLAACAERFQKTKQTRTLAKKLREQCLETAIFLFDIGEQGARAKHK